MRFETIVNKATDDPERHIVEVYPGEELTEEDIERLGWDWRKWRETVKVVNLSTTDFGGAFKAAERISEAMRHAGVSSSVIVRSKYNDTDTIEIFDSFYGRIMSKTKNFLNLILSPKGVTIDVFGTDISKKKQVEYADVVVVHWANSFLSLRSLKQLSKKSKKIIIVMHDMWLLTAGCHYDNYCGAYCLGCVDCPRTKSSIRKKIIHHYFLYKKNSIETINPKVVCISSWMKEEADKSLILQNIEKTIIHNPIADNDFFKIDDFIINAKKKEYKLTSNKKIVLFSALRDLWDGNKGFKYLKRALETYSEDNIVVIVCGCEKRDSFIIGKTKIEFWGVVKETWKMREIYNIADVLVAPSVQDNYPNTVIEAMACGVPVVAFNSSGMPDLITHKKNGYLADFEDIDDLMEGIVYCINNNAELAADAFTTVQANNDMRKIGLQYVNLVKSIADS